ncbi:MAG: GNAT family N-acetyltransferase [Anaerolineales bacterium]|nr:GNAT family N-acetyltransferase [Anaerolineales bacterium]
MTGKNIIQTLDDGLIVRTARSEDAEEIANFNGKVHVDPGEEFVQHIYHWTMDLFNGKHPTCGPSDFTVVEDTKTGKVVSSMCYISQEWAYEGIRFPAGRPELVGTLEDYRRKGLIRRQFEIIHQWGEERGHKLQFITGIPWYYRQFGYEMAVNLGGRRTGTLSSIPELKEDEEEKYKFRRAVDKDVPFLKQVYDASLNRHVLSCVRDESLWKYEVSGRDKRASMGQDFQIIEALGGEPVGYFSSVPILFNGSLFVSSLELRPGVSWFDVARPLLRQLKVTGEGYAKKEGSEEKPLEMTRFVFDLGEDHPLYHIVPRRMPLVDDPYAFYIRVPDLPGFLQMITPVLEERLDKSYMCGHSGELKLNFYKSGIALKFERGKITVEGWDQPHFEDASANFPGLTFIQLMFGYRSIKDLEDAFPDIYYPKEDARYLLNAIFPRKPSKVMALA